MDYTAFYLKRELSFIRELAETTESSQVPQRLAANTLNLVDYATTFLHYLAENIHYNGRPYWSLHLLKTAPYMFYLPRGSGEGANPASTSLQAIILLRNMIGSTVGETAEKTYKDLVLRYIEKRSVLGFVRDSAYGLDTLVTWYTQTRDLKMKKIIDDLIADLWSIAEVNAEKEYASVRDGLYVIDPLVRFYEVTGSESALKLAKYQANWFMNYSGIFKNDGTINVGVRANTHVESKVRPLAGIIRLGLVTKNHELIKWGKKIYDYFESFSGGIGWYPEHLLDRSGSESCCIRSMVLSAILLAKAGYSEYWDTVERTARNHLIESILTDVSWVRCNLNPPDDTEDASYYNVPERSLGAPAGWSDPNDWVGDRIKGAAMHGTGEETAVTMHCCNCLGDALYLVWHNIVTKNETGVHVNILLNRDSKRVRVNSYLPYEGKVEIYIHNAPTLFVRIPQWANKADVKVYVDRNPQTFEWNGNYVKLSELKAEQTVTLMFPQREMQQSMRIGAGVQHGGGGNVYSLKWRGDTVTEISPKGTACHLYRRENLASKKETPMKMVRFYVPEEELPFTEF